MRMKTMIRTYDALMKCQTFLQRFNYLKLGDKIGKETFGYDRYLNQRFYKTPEWKKLRDEIIIRDDGCDLGHPDFPIYGRIIIHHMNPLTKDDIIHSTEYLLDPKYLICVSHDTHNAIHYGSSDLLLIDEPVIRKPNDTCPWR